MLDGFIPYSRASLMMDVVATGMWLVLPLLLFSIYRVKRHRDYITHKRIQVSLGAILLVVVVLFEIDVRLHGWRDQAQISPYFATILFPFLFIHIVFATTTFALWATTVFLSLKRFPSPPQPVASFSSTHRRLGKSTALFTCFTSITGWIFYYLAFVATN